MRLARLSAAALALLAACADDSTSPVAKAGPPAAVVADAAASLSGRAGAPLANVTLKVRDAGGRGVSGQTVTFQVLEGGGTLAASTAVSGADGSVTLPAWTLGKSAVPQVVRAYVGSVSSDISVKVQTEFDIDVRFVGDMADEHRKLFNDAAARLRAIIISDLQSVRVAGQDGGAVNLATACGMAGLPTMLETIDDVVIFAAVQEIDGPSKVLARAGPCMTRSSTSGLNPRIPAIGIMSFDIADLQTLAAGGSLQDVITHEMLHVLGIGTMWSDFGLRTDEGLTTVGYIGAKGLAACRTDIGGGGVCGANVPVENTGGAGTRDGHWRESTFDAELMTGFAERGPMPISLMTIGALADLGYGINRDAKDDYTVPAPMAALSFRTADELPAAWEGESPTNLWELSPDGRHKLVRPKPSSSR